jgi:hypothetical protein
LAARQHGVIALADVCALGIGARAVQRRVDAARLFRIHKGVYALVPRPLLSREGRWLAAVLACGDQAALSHRSAAHLHELRATTRHGIDVIVPGRTAHRHAGIDLHRSLHLDRAADVTTVRGIPVTTVPRTLLDLAAVVPRRQTARALHQAELLRALDVHAIADQLERNPHAPGTRRLRAELGLSRDATASPLEDRFLATWRACGGPEPECNAYVDPGDGGPLLRPDFVWRDARTAVETDGRATHDTRHGFEDDRLRDQRLTAAGWVVIRVTDRQLNEDPRRILRLVNTVIVRRRP